MHGLLALMRSYAYCALRVFGQVTVTNDSRTRSAQSEVPTQSMYLGFDLLTQAAFHDATVCRTYAAKHMQQKKPSFYQDAIA